MVLTCNCKLWDVEIKKLNAMLRYAWNHGHEYEGELFVFCPWCGKKLEVENE
jgi:hypothetical protein